MARALHLARNGLYGTSPNPRVGCVLVREGRIVGEGWHERAGGPHAEVHALKVAGAAARGAIAFITLEPCSHTGKTPPCAAALVEAGISRVVYAMADPDPRVSGRGAAALGAAGINTAGGLLEAEARLLNAGYIRRHTQGRPWVRCKVAISLDGCVAAADGSSKWITGAEAREDVQRLRAQSCAILSGSGTVLADDPRLDVRMEGIERQPLRVVLDRRLRTPRGSAVLTPPGRCLIFTASSDAKARAALEQKGATVIVREAGEGFAEAVLEHLAQEENVNEVLVEAGPRLSGALLSQGLIDELIVYQAPLLLGDQAAGAFHLPELKSLAEGLRLDSLDMRRFGSDWRYVFRPLPAPG